MNPPIPEPMAAPPIVEKGPRPPGLKYLNAATAGLTLLSSLRISFFSENEPTLDVALSWIASLGILLLLYWLWQGSPTTRIWILYLSVFSLVTSVGLEISILLTPVIDESLAASLNEEISIPDRIEYRLWDVLSIITIFYLVSPAMKAYCAEIKQPAGEPD